MRRSLPEKGKNRPADACSLLTTTEVGAIGLTVVGGEAAFLYYLGKRAAGPQSNP